MITKENTKFFFVNKFKWLDSAPMGTVSTMFTYAFAESGYNMTLIIQGDPTIDVKSILENNFGLKYLENYQIKLLSKLQTRLFKTSANFYIKAVKYILSQREKNNSIVVISRNTTFLPYLTFLKLFFRIRVIFETHGYHGDLQIEGFPPTPYRPFLKLSHTYQKIEKLLLNRMDGLICITSPQQKFYLQDFVKIPTIYLPLGSPKTSDSNVNNTFTKDQFNHKKLCYIGRLNQHIDYKLVFTALRLLEDISINFTWIGLKQENFPVLEEEILNKNLNGRVQLKAWMPHNEMKEYLIENISVGLAAYKPTFQSVVFTCPSKIFDYFSLGLPVIAPKIATVEDIVENDQNGLFYLTDNAESLAKAITKIFTNKQRYNELQLEALNTAQKYSWLNRANNVVQFINEKINT